MQLFFKYVETFLFSFSLSLFTEALALSHSPKQTHTHVQAHPHVPTGIRAHTGTNTHTHSQTHARTSTVFPRQEEPVSICATNLLNKLNRFLVYSHRSNILTDNRNFKMNMPLKNFLVKYFFKSNKVKFAVK